MMIVFNYKKYITLMNVRNLKDMFERKQSIPHVDPNET